MPDAPPTGAPAAPHPPARKHRVALWIVPAIVLATSIIWVPLGIRMFFLEAFRIPSGSMSPTLIVGDQLFVTKSARDRAPARGDVVVFQYPRDATKDYVSRVMGVAGDRVRFDAAGTVFVNDVPLPRCELGPWSLASSPGPLTAFLERNGAHRYVILREPDPPPSEATTCVGEAACVVPPGHVFTAGDNRDNSYDGRYWGFVPLALVRGRARWIHAPAANGPAGRRFHDVQGEPVVPPELAARLAACTRELGGAP